MSYVSTIGSLDEAAVSVRTSGSRGFVRAVRPASDVLGVVGGVLASTIEGAVFLTVMGGLSLTFCVLVAGGY